MWTCQGPGTLRRLSDPRDTGWGYRWGRRQTQPAGEREKTTCWHQKQGDACRHSCRQYLIFPRVLQGADERPVATHGVSADGHPVRVSGEVGVDEFRELTEIRTDCDAGWSDDIKRDVNAPYLLSDVRVHAVVAVPGVLRGVNVETSSGTKVPALIFTLNVATTWRRKRTSFLKTVILKPSVHHVCVCVVIRGLVSGATMMMPCSAAASWLPALVMKFCSVHVRPDEKYSVKYLTVTELLFDSSCYSGFGPHRRASTWRDICLFQLWGGDRRQTSSYTSAQCCREEETHAWAQLSSVNFTISKW